jgi:hypothetical protein
MELLLGAGCNRDKKLSANEVVGWNGLVTLDINPAHEPDVVWDLESAEPLPFDTDSLDAIHAYDVLEHTGRQGDWRFFFRQWADFWRILKPAGIFFGISPSVKSPWAWGDPGHTRIISPECFTFLSQPNYAQVGQSPMTDYRFAFAGDFDTIWMKDDGVQFQFALQAVKPSRISI